MHDTYNLGWKIGAVVKGTARRSILATYELERRKVAQELIEFDHQFSRLFSGRPAKDAADEAGISMAEFKAVFERSMLFTSGISVRYGHNMVVANPKNVVTETLTQNIKRGMRFPSFGVLNQSDAMPIHFAERLKSNGRWRIIVFAGDITNKAQFQRVESLGASLARSTSFLKA